MSPIKQQPFLKIPALRLEQPVGVFYATSIPAARLLDLCFTDRLRAIPSGDGYELQGSQRELVDRRLRAIARYINTREAAFPNSVILAANCRRDNGKIEADEELRWRIEPADEDKYLSLVIPTDTPLAAIIDGQHRLFGFTRAELERQSMPVLCSIFLDLPRPFQAYLFATINSTQKPVDRSQTYELFGYNVENEPEDEWSPDKLAVFLARKLNTDPNSPFFGRILVGAQNDIVLSRAEARAAGRWMVSMATMVDGIVRLISTSPKEDADLLRTAKGSDRRKLAAKRPGDRAPLRQLYLETLDKVLYVAVVNFFSSVFYLAERDFRENGRESFLTKTVGVQALYDVLRELSATALEDKDFSRNMFIGKLRPLADIDFTYEGFQQASGQGRSLIRRRHAACPRSGATMAEGGANSPNGEAPGSFKVVAASICTRAVVKSHRES